VARRASFLETLPFLPDNARNARLAASISVYLDAGYKYGANGTDAIDCSGFVKAVFQDAFDVSLPRKAVDMYGSGTPVGKLSLETGDLVFFSTERWRVINHVGIYLGERKFVHASTSLGVTISSLDEEYWMRRYIGARRP
jgi:lipoprotein Spr